MSRLRRLWNVIRRATLDDDLQQELNTHLALIEEEERRNGASVQEARRLAETRFGHSLGYREKAVDGVVALSFEHGLKDLGFAARRLRRSPAFTLASILTLALAIGANVSLFAVVHRVLLNPLPYGDPARLIALDYGIPARNIAAGFNSMSAQLYHHLAEHARTLEGVAVYNTAALTLTGTGTPERIQVARATPSLIPVMRVAPDLGRWFTAAESVPGAPPVVVLSHGLWVRRYGMDRALLGRTVALDGVPTEVIGVMPASFAFPASNPPIEAWTAMQSSNASASFLYTLTGVARMREGITVETARAEMTGLIADLARVAPNQTGIVSAALPLQDSIVGRVAGTLWILMGSAVLVLIAACANVANLFLVRAEARQREVAVRRALGAGPFGIAAFFLAEGTLLSTMGGVIGLGIAWGTTRVLASLGPTVLPRLDEVGLGGIVIAFTGGLTALTAVVFGAVPLLRVPSSSATLREQGRGTASQGRHRARQLLMGAQVALALVLVVGSGLMVRSFQKLRSIDPGFNPASALTFSIGLPNTEYKTRREAVAGHHAVLDRLAVLPGVTAVSASTCLPLSGACFGNSVQVEGRVFDDRTPRPLGMFRGVAGGYIETLGMRLLRGRGIERSDVERSEPVAVVNKAFADVVFPNTDPLGQRIKASARADWLTIVGIVSNTPSVALAERVPFNQVFMPMSLAGGPDIPVQALVGPSVSTMTYVVRTATSPTDLTATARQAIGEVDAKVALAQVRTLQQVLDQASIQMGFTLVLIAIAATVALLLGVIGIYGVMSYIVSQRTGEIGVRLALGAEPGSVARMIVRQGGLVALSGVAVGLGVALAGSRLIASLLYSVSPRDPAVFTATTVLLLTIALLACWFPARRAAKLSPTEALRAE